MDPILPSIAQGLSASPSEVSPLFTGYFLMTAVAMPITGWVSNRIGGKRTLLLGLALVVVFAALAGIPIGPCNTVFTEGAQASPERPGQGGRGPHGARCAGHGVIWED
ncbi:MFS transporter [Spongiactinospora sp. TRM90649]|uniref:MFS transporter n=1 Tax=Spongiactinospora sp. TRM90649 TaxID=3031114 RepID=UPI0023F84EEA|nr:MFS transporter [Spongiactinospora sp. TRM90649]MDF5752004.1 MFS transporter [Spongiactinospora sp. TRM90649]